MVCGAKEQITNYRIIEPATHDRRIKTQGTAAIHREVAHQTVTTRLHPDDFHEVITSKRTRLFLNEYDVYVNMGLSIPLIIDN